MMTQERLDMRKIRDILRMHLAGKRTRNEIARSLRCGRRSVSEYVGRAERAGIQCYGEVEKLDDVALEAKLGFKRRPEAMPTRSRDEERPLPDYSRVHTELKRKGVTLALLWEEYRAEQPGGYGITQFCEYYRRWEAKLSLVMRQSHRAGEKSFVDYSGESLFLTHSRTGERTSTQLFVGVLGASSYTYAEASLSQQLPDWLEAHSNMYAFFDGVSGITVPDQLRSGVKDPCLYDPVLNPSYQDLAEHYGTCVIPARCRKPRDKAKVEAAVLVAQRWIVAVLRDRLFHSIGEMNRAIQSECLPKLNGRVMRHVGKSRRELWEAIDRPALLPLPKTRYLFCTWKKVNSVNIDYHVELEHHFYSVPHALTGKTVWIRASYTTVEILHAGKHVASHPRSTLRGKYSTEPAHRPANHRGHAEWTPERLIAWGASFGAEVGRLVEAVLRSKEHPEQGYRSVLGIVRLGKRFGSARLSRAAERALRLNSPSYRTVKTMLEKKQEGAPLPSEVQGRLPLSLSEPSKALAEGYVRGKDYYH
jgi:transposase